MVFLSQKKTLKTFETHAFDIKTFEENLPVERNLCVYLAVLETAGTAFQWCQSGKRIRKLTGGNKKSDYYRG